MSSNNRINTNRLLSLCLFLFLLFSAGKAQIALPSGTPESQGVSSRSILDFLDAIERSDNEMHGLVILRHGKIIAEGWWSPYRKELLHTMYSCSKSFTATAIGFAVSENKVRLQDKVISFFPNDLPDTVSANLSELTVQNLLTMSMGQDPEATPGVVTTQTNWVKGMLSAPIVKKPGSTFLYNSGATYLLSAIITKVTGEPVLSYLKPRLFDPLGIKDIDWETDPNGINTGGWGLRLRTEDMARFGQLFLQKGKWNGRQIIPASWIEDASARHIDQKPELSQADKDKSDWLQGYGYQMWRCRNNAYRGDGAFGQYIIVMPDQDAVIAITSETGNMQDELNLVWKHLLPGMNNTILSPSSDAEVLKKRLASLQLKILSTRSDSVSTLLNRGKSFVMETNNGSWKEVYVKATPKDCQLELVNETSRYTLNFGNGKWKEGVTRKHGPNLVSKAKNHFAGLADPKVAGAFRWATPTTLVMDLRYIESPHTERITLQFEGDSVIMTTENSFEKNNKSVIKGKVKP